MFISALFTSLSLTNLPTILVTNRSLENGEIGTPVRKGQLCLGNAAGLWRGLARCADRHQMYKPNRNPQCRGREQKKKKKKWGSDGRPKHCLGGKRGPEINSKGERWAKPGGKPSCSGSQGKSSSSLKMEENSLKQREREINLVEKCPSRQECLQGGCAELSDAFFQLHIKKINSWEKPCWFREHSASPLAPSFLPGR